MVENCYICKMNLETTEHLFYECETVHNLWKSLHDFMSSASRNTDFWSFQNIQIAVILEDKKTEFLVNNLIIITKYYVHKCRYAKFPPSWFALKNEFLFV